jgi:sortase A
MKSPLLDRLSTGLVAGGALLLLWVAAVYANSWHHTRQGRLAFEQLEVGVASGPTTQYQAEDGELLGQVTIDRIDLDAPILAGIAESTLMHGAGHVPGTAWPGSEGNVVLAAHRDMHFALLRFAEVGDTVTVSTRWGERSYVIESLDIVDPDNTAVLEATTDQLVLITCYPFRYFGRAPQRLLVTAVPAPDVGAAEHVDGSVRGTDRRALG